jgi:hypothetical protein
MSKSNKSQVVLKGEIHTSESDLAEERNLLVEGVDVLVLEGEREDADYGLLRSWYVTAMSIVGLILFDTLYTDHRVLVDLAEAQDAELVTTRESDAELVENANPLVEVVTAVLFYGTFVISVFYGLWTGDTLGGAFLLLGAALLPIAVLRQHGMNRSAAKLNRDQIIADKVADAAEEDNRVVAIVGGDHLDTIAERLPDKINPEKREPAYGIYSLQHAREVATPAFTAISILFVMYLIILELFRWAVVLV